MFTPKPPNNLEECKNEIFSFDTYTLTGSRLEDNFQTGNSIIYFY